MPGPITMDDVYAALEESAGLVDVACSREKVWPTLSAYGDELSEDALVVFAMAGGERHRGEVDYNFTVPVGGDDPYTVALTNSFTEKTDHPVGSLLAEIAERFTLDSYGVECGVAAGFKKIYAFFPLDSWPSLSELAELPSMPRSVGEHVGTFARYGLDDRVSIIGIDYGRKTMNVYFGRLPEACLEADSLRSLQRDMGLPEPSEQLLEFVKGSFSIYPTFSWETSEIQRNCFSVVSPDQTAFPARLHSEIGRFARNAPHAYPGERILVYGATVTPREEYHKLGVYYRKPMDLWSKVELGSRFDEMVEQA